MKKVLMLTVLVAASCVLAINSVHAAYYQLDTTTDSKQVLFDEWLGVQVTDDQAGYVSDGVGFSEQSMAIMFTGNMTSVGQAMPSGTFYFGITLPEASAQKKISGWNPVAGQNLELYPVQTGETFGSYYVYRYDLTPDPNDDFSNFVIYTYDTDFSWTPLGVGGAAGL